MVDSARTRRNRGQAEAAPGAQAVTLLDVARLAGVSTATVSRVLNDSGKVGQATRDRVRAAIDTLGYTPHFGGRLLAAGRSNTFGAVIPTMANAIFSGGLQAFQEVIADAGKTLLVASTDYNPAHELTQIRTLVARGAEGLLLIGADRLPETWAFLDRRKVPHVVTWSHRDQPGHLHVGFDNQRAAMEMTRQVLGFGHRDLAVISGIADHNDRVRDRLAGIRQAVADCDGAQILRIIEARYDPGAGAAAFRQMMAAALRPTAIICGNDVLAAGVLRAAREMGIPVPGQVSVVGFDDIDLASLLHPALTTVRVPQVEMGTIAARLLLDLVAGRGDCRNVMLEASTIQRASLAAPPGPLPAPAG